MKRKVIRKRSRRQKTLLAMAWFVFLFAFNLAFNVVSIFPFQNRREMETIMEIDKTEVIWQASAKSRNGYTNYLAINDDVAVFTNCRFNWNGGWNTGRATLVSRNTTKPVSSGYLSVANADYEEKHFMGYVNSDEVATIEYFYRWEDGVVRTVKIREESFIYHNGERYFWQVEDGPVWDHPAIDENGNYTVLVDLLERSVRAMDRDGNVIYQGPMND